MNKFNYKEKVRVIKGFYKGVIGEITGMVERKKYGLFSCKVVGYEYLMWVDTYKTEWINEDNLELVI